MSGMNDFRLHRPLSLRDAVALLPSGRGEKEHDRPRVLAGGQDLLTEVKERLVEPESLVDLTGLRRESGFGELDRSDAGLEIGALQTLGELERSDLLDGPYTLLREAAASVGSPQIRNVGTVGGNLCQRPRCWYYRTEHAPCLKKGGAECFSFTGKNKYNAILGGGPSYIVHPSDLAPALVALGAQVTLMGKSGMRTLDLERFFTLPTEGSVLRENVLATDEIVHSVRVPAPSAGLVGTYLKFRERESYDFALVSVAAALRIEGGRVVEAHLCLGGVAPIPWRCESAERLLVGRAPNEASWRAAAEEALAGAAPLSENGYKIPLAKNLIVRACRAVSRA